MTPLPEWTRRVFLGRSLRALGGLASLPLIAPGCTPGRTAPSDLRVLSAGDYEILAAAADAIVPQGGAFAQGGEDVGLALRIDRYLAAIDPEVAKGLGGALTFLEWGGGLLAGRLGRFSRMDLAGREAVLAALPQRFGLAREVYAGLRQLCLYVFYCADESWEAVGYDGPWIRLEPPR